MSEKFTDNLHSNEAPENQDGFGELTPSNEAGTLVDAESEVAPPQNELDSVVPELSPSSEEILALETGEQEVAISIIAEGIKNETGEVIAPEDLQSGDTRVREEVSGWLDRHPKVAKSLRIFTLSTAFVAAGAAPVEAKADYADQIINAVVQAATQQRNVGSQQQIYREQTMRNQEIQEHRAQANMQQSQRDLLNRQQLEREDLAHRRAMESIKDPHTREDMELSYRQSRERKVAFYNQERQETVMSAQRQAQQEQLTQHQRSQQQQIGVNAQNQVLRDGANEFLRNILMKR
jgi:hypothetical protein